MDKSQTLSVTVPRRSILVALTICALLISTLLPLSPARAASYTLGANTNYFAQHSFSTYDGATGSSASTGRVATGFGPTFSITHIDATPGSGTGLVRTWAPGNLPSGSGFPVASPRMNEVGFLDLGGLGMPSPGGGIRYQFSSALPLGTHIYLQDIDAGEVVRLRFYACGTNAQINPSSFDYLKITTSQTATAAFSTTDVTLTAASSLSVTEPLVAIIVRDANVCRVDYNGVFNTTTSWETYFSVPPTDPSIVKSMATPNPLLTGGTVSWTLTITNNPVAIASTDFGNPTPAVGVVITDLVDSNVTGVTAAITSTGGTSGGSCTVGLGGQVMCSGFSPLASGASIIVTVTGTLRAGYSGTTLNNTANVSSASPLDLNPNNNSSTSTTAVQGPGTFTITKVSNGGTDTFNFTHTNAATSSSTITTTSAGTPGTVGSPLQIASNGSEIVITETADADWNLSNISCVRTAGAGDFNPIYELSNRRVRIPNNNINSNVAFTCTFTNALIANLSITKTNTPASGPNDLPSDTLVSGTNTTYSLVVRNASGASVTGAVVSDPSETRTGITCPGSGNADTVTCISAPAGACLQPTYTMANLSSGIALGTLQPNATATLSFTCRVN